MNFATDQPVVKIKYARNHLTKKCIYKKIKITFFYIYLRSSEFLYIIVLLFRSSDFLIMRKFSLKVNC
jgi:hypothetical protein